ncbi:Nucleic acid-binding, OB-fold [Sesbania bispinosa]|nr:Nucleic acid-binding, OB-fold [Sesbania bispinosa]
MQGICIKAVIQKHLIHRFSNSVVEGDVYNVTNFSVTRNSGKFRATHHDYKLTFNANTRIVPCPFFAVPHFMGIVTGISEELNLTKEERQTRLMLIDMVDEMLSYLLWAQVGKIRCAIFGELIDTVKGFLSLPHCDVAISLISDNSRPISIRDQFLKMYSWRRVGELNHLLEDGTYIVQGFPYCDGCKREVYDMSPRYKIKILVSDETESTELVMFDSECYSLINISCKSLLADSKTKQCGGYPDEILDFIGQELLFRVELNKDKSSAFDDESLKVRKICFDPTIIKEFKELIEDETPLKAFVITIIMPKIQFVA